MTECPLYPFRMGKNPNLKGKRGKGSPEALNLARASKTRCDGLKTGQNGQKGVGHERVIATMKSPLPDGE